MKEKDYVERMKSESAELSEQQQNLLKAQNLVMESYLCILTERIRVEILT